ncbi:MAG: hypothetical protein AAGJ52_12410, partial [Pseudomonadota bacterium]
MSTRICHKTNCWLRVSLMALLLSMLPGTSWARSTGETLLGWVSKNGQVSISRGSTLSSELNCDGNPELAFSFAETASPGLLTLNLDGPREGQIAVEIMITGTCGMGTASFSYFHDSEIGLPGFGPGINVSPAATQITLPLQVGAAQQFIINYQMEGDRALSSRWRLIGEQITFIIDQTLGQASRRRALAQVNFRGNVVIPDDFTGRQLRRLRESGIALNRACRRASEGGPLDRVCQSIEESANTVELQERAARAFDTNAASAIATGAEQGGQIQNRNVTQRIAERRGGSRGFSASGLSLSYAGHRFDQRFLPMSLQSNDNGGSSLLGERWGAFLNGDIAIGERDDREKDPEVDFERWGITAGIDYRFDSGSILGALRCARCIERRVICAHPDQPEDGVERHLRPRLGKDAGQNATARRFHLRRGLGGLHHHNEVAFRDRVAHRHSPFVHDDRLHVFPSDGADADGRGHGRVRPSAGSREGRARRGGDLFRVRQHRKLKRLGVRDRHVWHR